MSLARELLYKYHEENAYIDNYFIFHCFFRISAEIYSKEWENACKIKINCCNLSQTLYREFDISKWRFVRKITFLLKINL